MGIWRADKAINFTLTLPARDIKKRLSSLDLAELPTVDEAREQVRQHQQAAEERAREQAQSIREQALITLKKQHAQRRLPLSCRS